MDGLHDLGGCEGFGRVIYEPYPSAFHEIWERKINAINGVMVRSHLYNMDQYRHAIERMHSRHYISASYYERVFTSVATLCVESGLLTPAEYIAAVGTDSPLAIPLGSGRPSKSNGPFAVGDVVLVKDEHVSGHTRMPAYIRGKKGVIVAISPAYPFPDAAAHGEDKYWEKTYDVEFNCSILWSDCHNNDTVHVGLFESYIEME